MLTTYFLWEHAVNDRLHEDLFKSLLIKHNRLTVFSPFPLFDQWYFTSLRRRRNKKITEIKTGSLSRRLFTRVFPAGSLCSSQLACVTQRWAWSPAMLNTAGIRSLLGLVEVEFNFLNVTGTLIGFVNRQKRNIISKLQVDVRFPLVWKLWRFRLMKKWHKMCR